MQISTLTRKVRRYAFLSIIIPLIALISCLMLYSILGSTNLYKKINWQDEITIYQLTNSQTNFNIIDCPKYKFDKKYFKDSNGKIVEQDHPFNSLYLSDRDTYDDDILEINEINLNLDSDIVEIIYHHSKIEKESGCIKHRPLVFKLLSSFSFLEKVFLNTKIENRKGFAKIKNPYIYGEISISRSARYFPANLIFKPLIILTAIFLFLYWKSNLSIFNQLTVQSKRNFFYLGTFSCLFLILHASFLGLDIESKLFSQIRRLIIIFFIFLEVSAQISLTISLVKHREEIGKYIKYGVLKIKVIFVTIVFLGTIVSLVILALGDLSSEFKHALEWNYFSVLLIYYLLSALLWNKGTSLKNQKF